LNLNGARTFEFDQVRIPHGPTSGQADKWLSEQVTPTKSYTGTSEQVVPTKSHTPGQAKKWVSTEYAYNAYWAIFVRSNAKTPDLSPKSIANKMHTHFLAGVSDSPQNFAFNQLV